MRSINAGDYEDMLISNREVVAKKVLAHDLKIGMFLDASMDDWSEITELDIRDGDVYINPVDYAHKDDGGFHPAYWTGEPVSVYERADSDLTKTQRIERLEQTVNQLIWDNDNLRSTLEFVMQRAGLSY